MSHVAQTQVFLFLVQFRGCWIRLHFFPSSLHSFLVQSSTSLSSRLSSFKQSLSPLTLSSTFPTYTWITKFHFEEMKRRMKHICQPPFSISPFSSLSDAQVNIYVLKEAMMWNRLGSLDVRAIILCVSFCKFTRSLRKFQTLLNWMLFCFEKGGLSLTIKKKNKKLITLYSFCCALLF